MTNPFFSIIIPTYNSAKTLSECLDSILKQTFADFEIVIMDGASKDDTITITKKYSSEFQEIRWISESDKGIYDAMNKGIKISKGDWIYFLGSDDRLYDRDVLLNIHNFYLNNKSLDIIYGEVFSERFKGIYGEEFIEKDLLIKNICHQAIFFNKNIFRVVGDFNLKYSSQADWDHNIKWFLNKSLTKKFVRIIVAYYADGGFSSIHGDDVFYRDLRLNYIKHGHNYLPFSHKFYLLIYEFLKTIKRKDFRKMKDIISYFKYLI